VVKQDCQEFPDFLGLKVMVAGMDRTDCQDLWVKRGNVGLKVRKETGAFRAPQGLAQVAQVRVSPDLPVIKVPWVILDLMETPGLTDKEETPDHPEVPEYRDHRVRMDETALKENRDFQEYREAQVQTVYRVHQEFQELKENLALKEKQDFPYPAHLEETEPQDEMVYPDNQVKREFKDLVVQLEILKAALLGILVYPVLRETQGFQDFLEKMVFRDYLDKKVNRVVGAQNVSQD
jgi:hypothetical protein